MLARIFLEASRLGAVIGFFGFAIALMIAGRG
jgi:hypothetical protein